MYFHDCGQPVILKEIMVGYSAFFLKLVNGVAVRNCPRCGRRIWVEGLEYRLKEVA